MADKCLKINTEGFNIGLRPLHLEDVFVPLKISIEIPRNVPSAIPAIAQKSSKVNQQIWDYLAKSFQSNHSKHMAILAPPGAGKSTLLQYITFAYAQNKAQKHYKAINLIPVLLRLRDVREQIISSNPPSLPKNWV